MAQDETYNGWTNYETWAVALWINNDQGWQESVHDALREPVGEVLPLKAWVAAAIVRENVEQRVCFDFGREDDTMPASLSSDLLGRSLERVDWDEIGAAFLSDVAEQDSYDNGED